MSTIPSRIFTTRSLNEHVGAIRSQAQKSLRDPETRQLAVKIVSDRVERNGKITAWGKDFLPPGGKPCVSRDEGCEITKVWNFLVRNMRYVFDINGVDTFATLRYSLEAGGGDCDDATIAFSALLGALGFNVAARVIATQDAPDQWVHIYPLVGVTKLEPTKWIPLDVTERGKYPGWEYDKIAKFRDYMIVGSAR